MYRFSLQERQHVKIRKLSQTDIANFIPDCQQTFHHALFVSTQTLHDMNVYAKEFHLLYNEIRGRLSINKWQLVAFLLILLGILWISRVENAAKSRQQNYLVQPRKGDIYKFRVNNNYSTLLVVAVGPDSITVYPNQYESERKAQIGLIDKPENYMFLPMSFSKDQLSAMYHEGTIYEIRR